MIGLEDMSLGRCPSFLLINFNNYQNHVPCLTTYSSIVFYEKYKHIHTQTAQVAAFKLEKNLCKTWGQLTEKAKIQTFIKK